MKLLSLLILTVMLGLLVSCNDDAEVVEPKGYFNSLTCTQKSSSGCGVDWLLSFNKLYLPENVQILINENIIIDQCDPKSYWDTDGDTISHDVFRISNYSNLNGTEIVNIRIFDMKNCSLPKTEKSNETKVDYIMKSFGGKKEIWVSR